MAPVSISGKYVLDSSDNVGPYLDAVGVSTWFQKMANMFKNVEIKHIENGNSGREIEVKKDLFAPEVWE